MLNTLVDYAPQIGLVFFFTFFMVTLVWVFRPGSKSYYQKQANIPLADGE